MEFLNVPGLLEIFENIAKYLSTGDLFSFRCCSRLCKELADLGLTKHKRLAMGFEEDDVWECPPLALQVIIEKCKALQEIHIESIFITDHHLHTLISNNHHLKRVYMRNCYKITDEGFLTVLQCKKLKSLTTANCTDSFLEGLVRNNIFLEEINLDACDISVGGFISFIKQQPLLRYILFPFCIEGEDVFEMSIRDVTDIISAVKSHCKNLEYICLPNYRDERYPGLLEDLAENCPKLKIISIPDTRKILMRTHLYFQSNKVRLINENLDVYEFNGQKSPSDL